MTELNKPNLGNQGAPSNAVKSSNSRTSGESAPNMAPRETRFLVARVDVIEDATGITILADVPGVSKENLELRLEGDALVIEGVMAPVAPGTLEPVYEEVKLSRYRRSFTLSRELDGSRTAASLKDGVLTLHIPKQADAKPRRIELTVT
ncbi:MAG: Hsp20/alpha crystallin family protein [Caldimonas sp.]